LGYHVLSGANLSATERSTILTATASLNIPSPLSTAINLQAPPQLALGAIERALLASWQDRELLERDDRESRKSSSGHKPGFRGRNNKAFALGDEGDEEMDEMSESNDEANLAEGDSEQEDVQVLEGLTDAGEQEYFALALERKYVAKEAYSKSKRTFRQAKDFVRKIKTSRNPAHAKAYAFAQKFKTRSTFTNNVPLRDKGQASGSGQQQRLCFKCGKPGHEYRNCTEKGKIHAIEDDPATVTCIFVLAEVPSIATPLGQPAPLDRNAAMADADSSEYTSASEDDGYSKAVVVKTAPEKISKAETTKPAPAKERRPTSKAVESKDRDRGRSRQPKEKERRPRSPSRKPQRRRRDSPSPTSKKSEVHRSKEKDRRQRSPSRKPRQRRQPSPSPRPSSPKPSDPLMTVEDIEERIRYVEKMNLKREAELNAIQKLRVAEEKAMKLRSALAEEKGKQEKQRALLQRLHIAERAGAVLEDKIVAEQRVYNELEQKSQGTSSSSKGEKSNEPPARQVICSTVEPSPLVPFSPVVPRSKVAAQPTRLIPRAKETASLPKLTPHQPLGPPPSVDKKRAWSKSGEEGEDADSALPPKKQKWTPDEWRQWRLGNKQEREQQREMHKYKYEELGKFTVPVPPEEFLKTSEPLAGETQGTAFPPGVGFQPITDRGALREFLAGTLDEKLFEERSKWTREKGPRSRSRIIQLPTWPRAGDPKHHTFEQVTVTVEQEAEAINRLREVRKVYTATGFEGGFTIDVQPECWAKVTKLEASDISDKPVWNLGSEIRPEWTPSTEYNDIVQRLTATSGTVKTEMKEEEGQPATLGEVLPVAEASETVSTEALEAGKVDIEMPDAAAMVEEAKESVSMFEEDNREDTLALGDEEVPEGWAVVDPGATQTILTTSTAESLMAEGKLHSLVTTSKKFMTAAKGSTLETQVAGTLEVNGLQRSIAYVAPPNSLRKSLIGLPALAGKHLDMGANPKLGSVQLKRASNGHLMFQLTGQEELSKAEEADENDISNAEDSERPCLALIKARQVLQRR
jgi:hypothetical protein